MNRQFKFRIWTPKTKAFVYTELFASTIYSQATLCATDFDRASFPDKECVIQQFAGLLDKNNREIYEGDILRIDNWGMIGEVYYRPETLCYSLRHPASPACRFDLYVAHDENYNFLNKRSEVVGNVFENPELLK